MASAPSPPRDLSSSPSSCGFARPPPILLGRRVPLAAANPPSPSTSLRALSAKWIDLLDPSSYPPSSSSTSIPLPGRISPPRSGASSFSLPGGGGDGGGGASGEGGAFAFGGYAELPSSGADVPPERFVVDDLWRFVPYDEERGGDGGGAKWGWTEVSKKGDCVPGPRLAAAAAVLPATDGDDASSKAEAVLVGGWDPQTPGTGGVILDDVSSFDAESGEWSRGGEAVPGGPTSRHVAVPLTLKGDGEGGGGARGVICVHNHRCDDHVLLLSSRSDGLKWERRPVSGDVPSSRGLHCAAPLDREDGTSVGMVVFGGAAQSGTMSNEAFVLDAETWEWTKLDCGDDGGGDGTPAPRAGACLCPLDESTVVLFGGATPGGGGLIGLDDVWALRVDAKNGRGRWERLAGGGDDEAEDDAARPPGRNAANLIPLDAGTLPRGVVGGDASKSSSYFLLQGGWYPFRKTYDDAFLLRVDSE
ncbi:hypothetical protein ACHAWF_015712 [Thalassiosira exigua]